MRTKLYINGFASLIGDVPPAHLERYFEARRLRRMEHMSKNTLWCAAQALEQAGFEPTEPKNMALSVAASEGALENTCKFIDSILTDGDELSSPTAFAGSVHNSTALNLSLFLQITGPCITTGQFDASFAGALLGAGHFLQAQQTQAALIVLSNDVNPVAAQVASQQPDLFKDVLRQTQAPLVRGSAAFVVSATPTEKTRFEISRFEFNRQAKPDEKAPRLPIGVAFEAVERMQEGKSFLIRDTFGGAEIIMETLSYVKP